MARKKKSDVPVAATVTSPEPHTATGPAATSVTAVKEQADSAANASRWAKQFRSFLTLPPKGVTVGIRDGHDWVIGFPDDPGQALKEKLSDAGFAYRRRDQKWTAFSHAPNRARIEDLARSLKAEFGNDVSIADYPVKQVVVAFDADPGPGVTQRLSDEGFHYRPDQTWNAEYTPQVMDGALDFARSLPDKARGLAR